MATKVEFEVEGSTVGDLWSNAVRTAKRVAGGDTYEITHIGHVQEADSVSESDGFGNVERVITRWRQEFVIKVDF